jgi:hypothetical protein
MSRSVLIASAAALGFAGITAGIFYAGTQIDVRNLLRPAPWPPMVISAETGSEARSDKPGQITVSAKYWFSHPTSNATWWSAVDVLKVEADGSSTLVYSANSKDKAVSVKKGTPATLILPEMVLGRTFPPGRNQVQIAVKEDDGSSPAGGMSWVDVE